MYTGFSSTIHLLQLLPGRFRLFIPGLSFMVRLLILLSLEPVGNLGGAGRLSGGVLTLDLNGHALVLLQVASEVGLLGGSGGLGDAESLDVALGIGLLDDGDLVGLELLKVKLLNKIGYKKTQAQWPKDPWYHKLRAPKHLESTTASATFNSDQTTLSCLLLRHLRRHLLNTRSRSSPLTNNGSTEVEDGSKTSNDRAQTTVDDTDDHEGSAKPDVNMADDASLAMAEEVSMMHVTKNRLKGDQNNDNSAHLGYLSDILCECEGISGQTYQASVSSSDISKSECSPHQEQHDNLPTGVNDPLAEYGHENGAQRVPGDEYDGHDDTVSQLNLVACTSAGCLGCSTTGAGAARVCVS
ncbi:hypothetical protein HG531_002340 [Fusarium graminearum]|nr:hypothetical protein HG531_002340 [Fusarium graminearum]